MLLPCRHMCLCGSCAQSLRYQSSSCPICRCPFKAALNLRFTQRSARPRPSLTAASEERDGATTTADTNVKSINNKREYETTTANSLARRESSTNSATPLLGRQKGTDTDREEGNASRTAATIMKKRHFRSPARPTEGVDVEATSVLPHATASSSTMLASRTAAEVHNASAADVARESATLEMKSMHWSLGGGGTTTTATATQAASAGGGGGARKCSQPPQGKS